MAVQRCLLAAVGMVLCLMPYVRSEMFTAMTNLKSILEAEFNLATEIKSYVSKEQQRLDALLGIADEYERHSVSEMSNADDFLANPVNAFKLVKRFTIDWEPVETLLRNNSADAFISQLKTDMFPEYEDLSGAATALMRLQDTYNIPVSTIAKGKFPGIDQISEMTVDDCYEIGREAYNANDPYHCQLWMTQALMMYNQGMPNSIDKAILLDYLAYAHYQLGNIQQAFDLTEEWLQLDPTNMRGQTNREFYLEMLNDMEANRQGDNGQEMKTQQHKDDNFRQSTEFKTYEALCRGEDAIPYEHAHKLTCQYARQHPYFYLVPLKEETLYLNPRLVIYHKILTDPEVDKIIELAEPRLARSGTFVYDANDSHYTKYRTSKGAWLGDEEHALIHQVSQKVKKIAQLSLETAEHLQVVNYGIGGHYEPHYDFARPNELTAFDPNGGNRIATAIFYMSDVAAGGATVFPQIGAKLFPAKGMLAFWHNLMKNGEGNYFTRHAACPVLSGKKWVANKWIHERGQELIYPCSLDPYE